MGGVTTVGVVPVGVVPVCVGVVDFGVAGVESGGGVVSSVGVLTSVKGAAHGL